MSRFRPVLNQHGVTEQQWRILRVLLDEDGLEPRQLCERCLISSPSIAGVLMRMEEAGLIKRERMERITSNSPPRVLRGMAISQ